MHFLLLGGTGFLGREVTADAIDRGHSVTCLARGSAAVDERATFIRADRDADDALASVASEVWEVSKRVAAHHHQTGADRRRW